MPMKKLIVAVALLASLNAVAGEKKDRPVYVGDGRYVCNTSACKNSETGQMVRQNNDWRSAETRRKLEQDRRK
jgi:hypothetical protein